MYARSSSFDAAIAKTHRAVARATVQSFTGEILAVLPVIDGSVKVDRNAAIRRTCSVTIADSTGTLVPKLSSDYLAPFGNELFLERGVRYDDGTEEYMPLGVFFFERVKVDDDYTISIDGTDRATRVARARFPRPYKIANNTETSAAIQTMLNAGVPGLQYQFLVTTDTTPAQVFDSGDDRWTQAQTLAAAAGMELYFDPTGVCVLRPEPDAETDPVTAYYTEGTNGLLLSASREWDTEQTYSAVIVTADTSGAKQSNKKGNNPVPRGVAQDNDENSPTYVGGSFGYKPFFYSSPLIRTKAQAQRVAAARLRRVSGSYENIDFGAVVNPAHEAGDIIAITRQRIGIDARYVLDNFTMPLRADGSMSGQTRRRLA